MTYCRKLGYHNHNRGHEIDHEVCQVVVRVVRADQEKAYGHGEQELLCGRVLVAIVDLLPHVQVVVCAGVELERHTPHVVEHEVAAEHVGNVDHGPGGLLRNGGDDVVENFEQQDDHDVDRPRAFHVHPVRVQVGICLLVAELLEILWRLMVHQAAASPPPSPFLVSCAQLLLGDLDTVGRRGVHPLGEGDAATLEDCGRHFGGIGGVLWGRRWSITRPEGKNGGRVVAAAAEKARNRVCDR